MLIKAPFKFATLALTLHCAAPTQPSMAADAPQIAMVHHLFDQHCVACHRADGSGDELPRFFAPVNSGERRPLVS
ncbi:MAG: hypothetical protein KGL68_03040 [Burkholderiales bacterium]|nr:hypothetical protein [Burkholderiales bacterium]